jgi:hypothetical protein
MTEKRCSYSGDREQALMAYLYDDITPADRSRFESHLAACARCHDELDELRSVRGQLTGWSPPQPVFAFSGRGPESPGLHAASAAAPRWAAWRDIPVWAQVAAAMLVLGVSAGIANLNVHYGSEGLTVRTGWSKPAPSATPSAAQGGGSVAQGFSPAATPWRSDLTALEQRLRGEMRSIAAARPATLVAPLSAATSATDQDVMRRVRELISASERRQERELALSVANVVRDVNASRAGDLSRIEHTLGALQTSTGAELMKQRQQMVNYLTQVSLRR